MKNKILLVSVSCLSAVFGLAGVANAGEEEWKNYSLSLIGEKQDAIPIQDINVHYLRNLRIRREYARAYLSNPKAFKWAGLATIVAKDIGTNIARAAASDSSIANLAYSLAKQAGWLDPNIDVEFLSKVTGNFLGSGNYFVYKDLYWQHLVAMECGIDSILLYSSLPADLIAGWREIATGISEENGQSKVWEGNKKLLKYEQFQILQKYVFDADRSLWTQLSQIDREKITLFRAASEITFATVNPNGDFGNFEDRWRWVEQAVVGPSQKLDSANTISGPELGKSMVDQVSRDLASVIENINLIESTKPSLKVTPLQKPACPTGQSLSAPTAPTNLQVR